MKKGNGKIYVMAAVTLFIAVGTLVGAAVLASVFTVRILPTRLPIPNIAAIRVMFHQKTLLLTKHLTKISISHSLFLPLKRALLKKYIPKLRQEFI